MTTGILADRIDDDADERQRQLVWLRWLMGEMSKGVISPVLTLVGGRIADHDADITEIVPDGRIYYHLDLPGLYLGINHMSEFEYSADNEAYWLSRGIKYAGNNVGRDQILVEGRMQDDDPGTGYPDCPTPTKEIILTTPIVVNEDGFEITSGQGYTRRFVYGHIGH